MPEKIDKETIEAVCDGVRALLNMTKVEISKAYLRAPKAFTIGFKATFAPTENPEVTGVKIDLDFIPEKVHESVTREASETTDMLPGCEEAVKESREKAKGAGKKTKEKKQDPMTVMPQGEPPARKCGRPEEEACGVVICKEYAEMCSPGCERPQPAINGQKALEGDVVDAEFTDLAGPSKLWEKPKEEIELKEEEKAGGIPTEETTGSAEEGTGNEGEGETQPAGAGEESPKEPLEDIEGLEKPEAPVEDGDAVEGSSNLTQDELDLKGVKFEEGKPDLDKMVTEAVKGANYNDSGILEGELERLSPVMPKGILVTVTVGLDPAGQWKMGKSININLGDIFTEVANKPSLKGPGYESADHARLAGLESAREVIERALEKKTTAKQKDVLEKGVQVLEEKITEIQSIIMFNMDAGDNGDLLEEGLEL